MLLIVIYLFRILHTISSSIYLLQEKELRSAPAKPKSLVPPHQRLGPVSTGKLRHQGSSERTPTPTQQAHLKKIKSQTSEEKAEKRKETQLQRQILFDEIEEVEDRIEVFKADAKAETISVQGSKKFDKIVNFNKQLRQFKKVHDRNKIICQESLRENCDEEENYFPKPPETKELQSRYKKYERPKLVRKRSEKMMQDFHDKHKKLTEAFFQTKQMMSDKVKAKSPPQAEDKAPSEDSSHQKQKEEESPKEAKRKGSMQMKHIEDAIFKGIESLNKDSKDAIKSDEEKSDEDAPIVSNINLLSTTIDETFENMVEALPAKDIKTTAKGNIKDLIMKFQTPVSEAGQRSDSDTETSAKNGKDSLLTSKQKFLDVFTRTTPIFSSIDETWSPTNSMNQEVINFQEELLNFEADSLNPPEEGSKRMSFSNAKAIRRLSFEEMEADNFVKERNRLKETNEKNNTADITILKKGYNFLSGKLSEDKAGEKIHNFGQAKVSPVNQTDIKRDDSDKRNNILDVREMKGTEESKKDSSFQNGFLVSSSSKLKGKENQENIETATEAEEKKTSPKVSITSEFKHRFLSSFSFEKAPPESLESSIFGSSGKSKDSLNTEKDKSPRKKSVHFETDEAKKEKEVETSPIQSYFPIIGSILSAGPSNPQVPDTSEDESKRPNSILINLTTERGNSRKESLESIETVDTVDLELIKLGLHKSSGDIRTQYLTKLHITSPPSSISSSVYTKSPNISPISLSFPTSTTILTAATSSVVVPHSSSGTATTTTTASDQYTELLRTEEKITAQNARLATQFEAQKSSFDPASKCEDVPSSSTPGHAPAPSPPPFLAGPRARPPLRPMYMVGGGGGGYMAPPHARLRALSPRMRFPPPHHLKASPPMRPGAGAAEALRMSPPPRMVMFRYGPGL